MKNKEYLISFISKIICSVELGDEMFCHLYEIQKILEQNSTEYFDRRIKRICHDVDICLFLAEILGKPYYFATDLKVILIENYTNIFYHEIDRKVIPF